jgi:C-terminal peptidase prc
MIERFAAKVLLLLLSGYLVLPLRSAESAAPASASQPASASFPDRSTNSVRHVTPGLIDGRVAFLTAAMLEKNHYLKLPFDAAVSSRFLDTYLETLDPQHIHFTQSDLAEFEPYRTNLNRLTLTDRRVGDTRPACEIFNRFFERLSQRTAYAEELLKNEKFTFDGSERITINRKELPYPANLDEAKKLWRERLRFEYLQERLGKLGARKKKESQAAKKKAASPQTNVSPRPRESQGARAGAVETAGGDGARLTKTNLQLAVVSAETDQRPQTMVQSPKGAEQWPSPGVATSQGRGQPVEPPLVERPQSAGGRSQAASKQPRQTDPTASASTTTNDIAVVSPKKTDEEEIIATLTHRYHRNLRFFADWNNEDVLQTYLTALARVYDPHSDYLGRAQLESFAMTMNLSLFGIGAELTVSEDGYCTIRRLLPGGPAIKSKLIKENDRIAAVAQGDEPSVDIVDLSLNKAVQLIRGPKGTEVRLTIIPAGGGATDRKVVKLIRDEIPLEDSAAKAKLIEVPDGHGGNQRLGVIDLPSFYATFDAVNSKDKPEPKSTTTDVAKLLAKLKQEKVEGVILDLRRNGGGSLEEAIRLTGLFIKTGPVVQVKEVDETVQRAEDTDPSVLYEGPLVVLTSRGSASASEILAGALQDYGRALIVGDSSTHGKGTVQSVNQLRPFMQLVDRSLTNDPGALKLTIKKFYRPSGVSTQLKGVVPDIILPSVANESKDIGEGALDNALPQGDPIPSAKYDHFNLVEPYLPELRKRSAERLAADKEYTYVREDIERFKKQQADKTISLNEQVRLKDNDELEARNKARDEERRSRPDPAEKVYELTLKLVDLPGLPPPVARTNAALASLPADATTIHSGASTNSTAVATADDGLEDAAEPPAPGTDAPLAEGEHILLDYLSLLPKGNLVTAGR